MKELDYNNVNCKMYYFYLNRKEMEVRTKKGVIDTIYAAVLKKTLKDHFEGRVINFAVRKGIIAKSVILMGREHRTVYYYALEELGQVTWWKRLSAWTKFKLSRP